MIIAGLLAAILVAGCAKKGMVPGPSAPVPKVPIVDGHSGATMSLGYLTRMAAKADAIFIGEIHNDSLTHVLELALLKDIHRRYPDLAVTMEMFERDVQPMLDRYLAGKIDEPTFLSGSRPWGNYKTDYRPIVEFAREHGLPVIAMNVPRKYAGQIAMRGPDVFKTFPDSVRPFMAEKLKVLDDEYKVRFLKTMTGDMPHAMSRMIPDNLYAAQCLKDDTMAESIHAFMKTHPQTKVISYQGDFHSHYSLGIVKKLKLLNPSVKTAVISIVPVSDVKQPGFDERKGRGDYIIFVQGEADQ